LEVRDYTELRNRGVRISLLSSLSLILIFIIYSQLTIPQEDQLLDVSPQLRNLANIVLFWTFISIPICICGIYMIFRAETERAYSRGNRLGTYLMITFADIKYWRIMIISSVLYWICFGFLSQILLYEPDISFSEDGTQIPSVAVTPCCNLPGYVPMLSTYLTEHFVILIIPVNFALSIAVSAMVGFNISLMVSVLSMARRSRSENKKLSVIGGIGITTGLFVGCPTCAGSLISVFAGFGSGVAISVLAPFQTLFLLISIPTLVISPFIISQFMKDSFTCNFRTSSIDTK
jgi:hypothetical protein